MCKGKIILLETVYEHMHVLAYLTSERETKLMQRIIKLHSGYDSCELVDYVYLYNIILLHWLSLLY